MCGIAGMFGKIATPEKVDQMVAVMHRRGPDDSGTWKSDNQGVVLGQARLSIIDLSSGGHQPMILQAGNVQDDKRLVITFNGEIYNYKELRGELESQGAKFRTHSDTEVILWGWKIWGKATLKKLRGMFAFAIWDEDKQVLTLARDRMGIKPLLWSQNNGTVVFASSLGAILASGEVRKVLSEQGLYDYLLQGAVLQPRTMIKNVWALEPGTMMEFKARSKVDFDEGVSQKYWSLERNEDMACELAAMTYEDQVKITRKKLEEACKYHLIADVPVGSFLSGGVDSTAITALMTRLSGEKIKSFSIGFSKETGMQDELSEAQTAAGHIGTDHTEVILSGRMVSENFHDFIETLDQPSVDGLNTYWVSKVTRANGVKVALSGLGGDELFAGYDHFRWAFDNEGRVANPISTLLDRGLLALYHHLPYSRQPFERCRYLLPLSESLLTLRRFMSEGQLQQSLSSLLKCGYREGHLLNYINNLDIRGTDAMQVITKYECRNYLLNTLLRDADALSMGHGIEARPIFLDHHLVELALALPADSKWKKGTPKAILKDATKDLLPAGFFERRKTGFTLPTYYWLENELKDHYQSAVELASCLQCFSPRFLSLLRSKHEPRSIRRFRWQIFVLLNWMDVQKVSVEQGNSL
jgi:asparagine synthase (glutamine-hydrolysing)